MKIILLTVFYLYSGLLLAADLPARFGEVDSQLFVGEQENQPLVVGFGGAEGGNAWASDYWQDTRNEFLAQGYAFLAVGYFGMPNTTPQLDRVSLDAIHEAIIKATKNAQINGNKIALIGGSKGAELVLNLASRYPDINAVVAIVPSHVSFPGLTYTMQHSSWMFNGEEVPFIPANERIIPAAMSRDLHTVFSILIEDQNLVDKARIPVEQINGPVLIMSDLKDEMWPSHDMSNQLVDRLKKHQFAHHFEHIVSDGGHTAPLENFSTIFKFLEQHFKAKIK